MKFLKKLSWKRLSGIIVKEFIQAKRDRLTLAMMMIVPIVQLILFGFAINTNPRHLSTAVVMADNGPYGRTILYALKNSSYFEFNKALQSEADAHAMLQTGQVQFVINIPPNFSRNIIRGERPTVLIEADATDPVTTGTALSAANALVNTAFLNERLPASAGSNTPNGIVNLQVHSLYNPESISAFNIIPGLMGVILTMTMTMVTGLAITRERERGTMENLLATPLTPAEVLIGKIIPYVIIGYTQITIIILAAILVFHLPFFGSITLLYASCLPFIAANLAMGITFSTIAKTQMQAMQMTFFVFLPSILLSGYMFPFRGMPGWAQAIGEVLPITHFLRITRGIILKGNGIAEIWPELLAIIAFAAVILTIAIRRYRQTLD